MEKYVIINAHCDRYDKGGDTMTVGELIEHLQQFDKTAPVYTSHDGGYMFGSITENDVKGTAQ